MLMTQPRYNFAVYTEIVYGKRHYQGYGLTPGLAGTDEWLPVSMPEPTIESARLGCKAAHEAILRAGKQMPFLLHPDILTFEWTGSRRILNRK